MALDAPPLALDDIIHTLSPSPTPEAQVTSPEPLTDVDITRMRRRVQEMGLSQKDAQNPSSREQELADMVLRLTESTLMESTQLVRQAETIAGLMLQRDYLVVQVEEERARWESEKEGWARMAEALIAQRNRPGGNATRDPELERHFSAFESDNRALREKLHDTQTRLQTLEAELTKLRPILLMQPFPSTTSQSTLASISHASTFLSSVPYPSLSPAPSNAKIKLKKKKKESRVAVYSTTQDGQEAIVLNDDSNKNVRLGVDGSTGSFSQFQAHPAPNAGTQPVLFSGDHYRKPTVRLQGGPLTTPPTTLQFQVDPPAQPQPGSSQQLSSTSTGLNPSTPTQPPATPKQPPKPKKNNTGSAPLIPLTSDARSEHLLLAARKIGRERAGIVAGFIKDRQREMDAQKAEKMEKERERRERVGGGERGGVSSYYRKDSVGGSPTTPKMVRVIGTPGAPAVSGMGGSHYPNFPALAPGVSPRGQGQGKGQGLVPGFNYDAPPAPARPLTAGSSGNYPQPSTPRQAAAAIQQGQSQQAQGGPSTPLASLLDAARMMDDDAASGDGNGNGNGNENGSRNSQEVQNVEDEATATTAGVRRDASLLEDPESPRPKRRRLGTGTNGGDAEGNEDSLGRVRSALDVLADQAAAFSSVDRRAGKGKAREIGGKEVLATEVVGTPAKGRGRGKAKVREKEKGKEREKEREKEKQDKTETPPVLTGRKPRVRAPPKPRRLVPAPPAVASLPTPTSAKGKEKAGTAVPRLISPPGPKSSGVGASPLDRVSGTGLKRSGGDGHGLRKGGGTTASREESQFGFRPVSWARPGEEEEGSSPVVDVRELRRKRREENNALMVDNSMIVDEAESLVAEESVPSGPGKDGKERENENENENEVEDDPVVPPPGPTSPIPSLAMVLESAEVEAQEESIVLRDELVESTEQVKKPPDGEDAEMDDLQTTTIEQGHETPQIEHPPEEVQTKERLPSPPEINTTPLKESSPPEEQTPKDSNGSPQSQSIGEVSQIQLGIADQEISNDDEPRGVEDERMVEPMPTTQEQARLSPLHPTTPPLAGLNIDHLQRIVLDADAEADTDPDLDADGDADADGEADAEGEADVDAEGEIDPDVELIVAHDEVQESGNSPRENGLYPASIPDVSSQDPLASGSSMLSTSESIDSYSKATSKLTSQDLLAMVPDKRPRSPYVKWTKEEDELLAEAVNKHGHKWDLVQKALPSRGYHQVRQRWLRRLGLLDNK